MHPLNLWRAYKYNFPFANKCQTRFFRWQNATGAPRENNADGCFDSLDDEARSAVRAAASASTSAAAPNPVPTSASMCAASSLPGPSPSPAALNLHRLFGPSVASSILRLPEVRRSMLSSPRDAVRQLKRAAEILERVRPGSEEHRAVLMLLADKRNESGRYRQAASTLRLLLESTDDGEGGDVAVQLQLAQSKADWNAGRFREAFEGCEAVLSALEDVDEDKYFVTRDDGRPHVASEAELVLRTGAAMNGLGVSLLCLLNTTNLRSAVQMIQPDSVEDIAAGGHDIYDDPSEILRQTLGLLREGYREADMGQEEEEASSATEDAVAVELRLAAAATCGNLGVSLVATTPGRERYALKTWDEGLSLLDELPGMSTVHAAAADLVRARLCCNAAWGLLFASDGGDLDKKATAEDDLALASDYARRALEIYDGMLSANETDASYARHYRAALARSLGLVASCYTRAGSGITAEGLFQSALDGLPVPASSLGPLHALDARDVRLWYATLCDNWEKRGGDAERLRQESGVIKDEIEKEWRGQLGVYSGLSFYSVLELGSQ